MVRPAALTLLAAVALIGCGQDDTCDPNCGVIRDKKISFSHSMGSNVYRYTIDNECNGDRYTVSGYSSIPYDAHLIGDRICKSDIW